MKPDLMRLSSLSAALVALAHLTLASASIAQVDSAGSGRVTGVVRDSLAGGAPLEGAHVQLVSSEGTGQVVQSASSDREGRFVLAGVPQGRYLLGFLHPLLDSLGIEPPVRTVVVDGTQPLAVELGTPSPARLRASVCGATAGQVPPALVMGVVRRAADGAPIAGAVVTANWFDAVIRRDSIGHRLAGVADTTARNGWFALCDVPQVGTVVIAAVEGASSTDRIEVEVSAQGFARRDLVAGESRPGRVRPAAAGIERDSAGASLRGGDGTLRGTVLTLEGQRPIAGVRVGIAGGPATSTDGAGSWALFDIPSGTRVLEVRAVGYLPRRMAVDVIPGAPALEVLLSTMMASLDTVRVTASRLRLEGTGFDDRRRSGAGRYITSERMIRSGVIFTSDVFQTVPGIRMERSPLGDARIMMRSPFGICSPAVYIDGQHMPGLSTSEIDAFVDPNDVAGIEVYTPGTVPQQFQPGMTGCGSLVIWTTPSSSPVRHWSMRRRALHGLSAMLLGAGIGAMLSRM